MIYTECLAQAGIEPSIGSVGDSCDHALAEVIYRRGPWRPIVAIEFTTLQWVDWFKGRRPLKPTGYNSLAVAEEYHRALLQQGTVAGLTLSYLR